LSRAPGACFLARPSPVAVPPPSHHPDPPSPALRWAWLWLCLAVLLVYVPTFRYEFNNFDDPSYVTANRHVTHGLNWTGVKWAFTGNVLGMWHPLTGLSHMLDWELFGRWAGGHHAMNVLFHAANAVMLWWLLRRLTGASWPSLFVALLFAVHPLNVESVAWVSQRKSVLSTCFFFGTLLAWQRFAMAGSRSAYGVSVLCFALGLLTKPMLVSLPLVLLLLDVWPLRRWSRESRQWRRLLVEKIPFFVLSAVAVYVLLHPWGDRPYHPAEPGFTLERWERALANTVAYLRRLIWPMELAPLYPHRVLVPGKELALALGVLSGLSILAWKRGRAQWVGWWWFLVVLFPVSGIQPIGPHEQADRYAYLPAIGIFLYAAWFIPERAWFRPAVRAGALAMVGALAFAAARQVGYWKDSLTLWTRATAVSPPTLVQQLNYGHALLNAGRIMEAEQCFENVVRLSPEDPPALVNLASARLARGRVPEAIQLLEQAVRVDPRHARARGKLGSVLHDLGRNAEAQRELERALALDPELASAHVDLGVLLAQRGELAAAEKHFAAAVTLDADDAIARQNLILVRRQLGSSFPGGTPRAN